MTWTSRPLRRLFNMLLAKLASLLCWLCSLEWSFLALCALCVLCLPWHSSYSTFPSGAPSHGVAAAIETFNGLETWHFFYTPSNWYTAHVVSLGVALQWALRGLHIGQRRVLFLLQVDDLFLDTREWIGPGQQGPAERTSGDDLRALAVYQHELEASLPAGSTFKVEMAFNGLGVDDHGNYTQDELALTAAELLDQYYWVSHTYKHPSLDPFHAALVSARCEGRRGSRSACQGS